MDQTPLTIISDDKSANTFSAGRERSKTLASAEKITNKTPTAGSISDEEFRRKMQ
jgi:hypothetical protein